MSPALQVLFSGGTTKHFASDAAENCNYNVLFGCYICNYCRFSAGFTSDFLSFVVVEHIWFFHRALQLLSVLYSNVQKFFYIGAHLYSQP